MDEEHSRRPPPETIGGRYTVEEVVGRGGMGAVYRVRDQRSGEALALKRLTARGKQHADALALFEREFHTLAQLKHPRIIDVYEYGVDQRGAFYTMELLRGADMRQLCPLPWDEVCRHLREVATSLALLHARRLLHRDVTPRNVRITPDGHCKLIDFGALAEFGEQGAVVGTPPCVPPEALDGQPLDQRADLYALGCLGYWMLTGRHAYPATDSRQLRTFWARAPEAPSALRPGAGADRRALPPIPPKVDALIMGLIQLDRMARPGSAGAVIDHIDVILGRDDNADIGLAESYLESAPLVGRETELSRIAQRLNGTLRGRGASFLVTGDGGAGRSRLLAEAALRAKLRGLLTIRVNAEEHGTQPYGVAVSFVSQLIGLLPEESQPALALEAPVLGHLMPELRVRLPEGALAERPDEATQWRSMCQGAMRRLLCALARVRPLCLLIDDLHRADESSASLLGTLAREARGLPLLIIATARDGDEQVAQATFAAVAMASKSMPLRGLDEPAISRWLGSVFGDAPNLPRLSRLLLEHSDGNPAVVMELLRFLFDNGLVGYRDGTWQLPHEPERLELPARAEEVWLARLRLLSEAERKLAATLSMQRGDLPLSVCQALSEIEDIATLHAQLDALLGARVLECHQDGYRFTSEALRELLHASIPDERRPRLHRRLADAMLAQGEQSVPHRLQAGLHLLEAGESRGSDLVVEASIELGQRIENLSSCVGMLETALPTLRARGESPARLLAVLVPLGIAAYMVDRSLDRYEAELRDAFDRASGMGLARKLSRRFGRLGALLGLGIGAVRYFLRPASERPYGYQEMMQLGVTALVSQAGKCGICLDRVGIERIMAHIEPLSALGVRHPGGFAHAFTRAVLMVTEDRYDRTYRYMRGLEAVFRDPTALRGLPPTSHQIWASGIDYVLGVMESFRGDASALSRAQVLEDSGVDLNQLVAAQIRLQYHGFRGEAEEVRKAHDQLEACAIQTGSSWQVQTWSAIVVNLFGGLWGDVIIAKRSMTETVRMREEMPSIERYAATSEATYALQRGKPQEAVRLYEAVLSSEPPLSRIGWSVSQGILASAHNELGEYARAREICEWVFETVDPEDEPYCAMRIAVDTAYITALGYMDDFAASEAHTKRVLASYAPSGSPFVLGTVHEAAARVAFRKGDRKTFTRHLKQVEAHFTTVGNPALIARFQRLTDIAGREGGLAAKVAIMREIGAFHADLDAIKDPVVGARHILAWLMETIDNYEGYLLGAGDDEPLLLAATTEDEPVDEVFDAVAEALDSLGSDADTTNFGTEAATQTRRDGNSRHIFLLSYQDADRMCGAGALVLMGKGRKAPPVRYELLQAAAEQVTRLTGKDPGPRRRARLL